MHLIVTDSSLDYLERGGLEQIAGISTFQSIKYLRLPQSIGFARSVNAGILHAIHSGAKWVTILNQDTIVSKVFFETLFRFIYDNVRHPSVYVPLIFDISLKNILPSIRGKYLQKISDRDLESDEVINVKNYPATCYIFSAELVEKMTIFDSLFYMYGEDYDFCKRLEKRQGSIGLIPHLKVGHHISEHEPDADQEERYLLLRASQIINSLRHGNIPLASLYFMCKSYVRKVAEAKFRLIFKLLRSDKMIISRLNNIIYYEKNLDERVREQVERDIAGGNKYG